MAVESASRDAWSQVELGERRVLPALPGQDADLGEIRWGRWERHIRASHIDSSCGTCGYEGPLAHALGMTLHQDRPRRKLLKPSRIAQGQRPQWGPAITPPPRWVYTHTATRCQACDEMFVWCMSGQRTRCQECAAVTPKALEGTRAQCPVCLRPARHVVPGGTIGQVDTWCEVAYNPPRSEQVPVRGRSAARAPQAESLF